MNPCNKVCDNKNELGYCKSTACIKKPDVTMYKAKVVWNDDYNFEAPFAPQGWQCPICHRVYSPMTMMCLYCAPSQTTVTTTGTGSADKGMIGKDLIDWILRNNAEDKPVYRRMDYGSAEEKQVKEVFMSDGDYATDAIVIN